MAVKVYGQHYIGTTSPAEDPVQVGSIWVDTSANLLKRCTSVSPYTWVSTEGGSSAHDLISATHSDTGGTPSAGDYMKYDGAQWEPIKNNWAASAAPGVNDDSAAGYEVGSRWIDTTNDKEYVCLDASVGAAVWTETTGSAGGGEANTASNVGTGGVGVFKQKTGVDFEFKKVNAGSTKVSVTDDVANNEVDVDVVEAQLSLANLGTRAHANLTSVGTDDHHPQAHSIASHSDTTATGAELETLTDGVSSADALHLHSHGGLSGVTSDQHHAQLHAASHADGGADELAVQDLASDAATDGQVAKADGAGGVAFEDDITSVSVILDGGGSVITTGVKAGIMWEVSGVLEAWTVLAIDGLTGAIVIDVWKDTYANHPPTVADTIAGTEKPTITATGNKGQDTSLTSFSTTISAGDIWLLNVDSVTTLQRVLVSFKVRKS